MTVGTRSVLFGAHQFLIHPLFVAAAWTKLYGFPTDPRLWVAFYVHDLGYLGKPNMDGPEGETHVEFGAKIIHRLFDRGGRREVKIFDMGARGVPWRLEDLKVEVWLQNLANDGWEYDGPLCSGNVLVFSRWKPCTRWHDFCLYHSRFYAKNNGAHISQLCVADKLSITLTPWWLYIPMVKMTGEWREYVEQAKNGKYKTMNLDNARGLRIWFADVQRYIREWVEEHRDLRPDTWTPTI